MIKNSPRSHLLTFGNYAIDEAEYDQLVNLAKFLKLNHVVEFGPGTSTFAWLEAGCRVTAFESNSSIVEDEWLSGSEDVREFFCAVDDVPDEVPAGADLVFVDGPPGYSRPMAREVACRWAMETVGRLLLHDSKRPDETAIVRKLQAEFGASVVYLESQRGLALLRRSSSFATPTC